METETGSEPHGDATPSLPAFPLYVAVQLQVPMRSAAVVFVEEYDPLPKTVTVWVKAGAPEPQV